MFSSNFVPKTHCFWDIRLQKCRHLENRVKGPSRSFEISPFDRAHTTSYWCSIVTMALFRVVSEIFNVEKCRDMSWPWNRGQRSLKVIESGTIRSIVHRFLLVFIRNFSLKRTGFEIFDFENCRDLEIRVKGHSRSSKMIPFHGSNHRPISHHFRDKLRFPSKIAKFSYPRVFIAPLNGFPLEFGIGAGVRRN